MWGAPDRQAEVVASFWTGPTAGLLGAGGAVQQLHLVGFTTDHKGLILGTRRGTEEGSFVVTLDRALVEHIEELLRLQAGESTGGEASSSAVNGTSILLRRPKAESRLTPREVQSMLRTGSTVSEVAEAAGMSEDWVGRFAPPILAEQARVIERATGQTYTKAKVGASIQPLGESVVWNLAEKGIVLSGEAVEDAWSAFQQPDGGWVVRVSFLEDRRRQHADWTIDMSQGTLKAINKLANELAYVEAGRRRPTALPPAAPVSASAQRAAAAPPKPAPPPPLAARPSGRLSLLSSGAGGVSRSSSSAPRMAPPERPRDPYPRPAPASKRLPRDGESTEASTPSVPTTAGTLRTPGPTGTTAEERDRPERPARPMAERRSLRTPDPAPAPASAPGSDRPAPPTGDTGEPRPRRERPLRAPSSIRRDELSERTPAVSRRPVLPDRDASLGSDDPAPGAGRAANRFGPAHSPAEGKVSTAERFGIGRTPGRTSAETPDSPVAPLPRRAPRDPSDPPVSRRAPREPEDPPVSRRAPVTPPIRRLRAGCLASRAMPG